MRRSLSWLAVGLLGVALGIACGSKTKTAGTMPATRVGPAGYGGTGYGGGAGGGGGTGYGGAGYGGGHGGGK